MPDIELTGEAVVKLGPLEITLRSLGDKPLEAVRRLSPAERRLALQARKEQLERALRAVDEEICHQEP